LCPQCDLGNGHGTLGPAQTTGSVSGNSQAASIHVASSAAQATAVGVNGNAGSSAGGSIFFVVSGQPQDIALSVNINFPSGVGQGNFLNVTLLRNNGGIGAIHVDGTGQKGSLPKGPFDPATYELRFRGDSRTSSQIPSVSFSVDISVDTRGAQPGFHWINPNGGDFSTAVNWNPVGVPGAGDTTIFDLPGTNVVTVQANNETVSQVLLNHQMSIALNGSLQGGLLIADGGGNLTLQAGATLSTPGGGVVNDNATVSLAGAGTRWTSTGLVQFGGFGPGSGMGPGLVSVLQNAVLDAQTSIDLGNGSDVQLGVTGTLEVRAGGVAQTPLCTVNDGQLSILDGGSMQLTDGTILQGRIDVSGEGASSSRLDVGHNLSIGNSATGGPINGSGSLLIEDGGTVRAARVFVGDLTQGNFESVVISGAGTSGNASSLITAGESATLTVAGTAALQGTEVRVIDGGLLSTSNDNEIGFLDLPGRVLVHGKSAIQPSTWASTSGVSIGSRGIPSDLVIEDGGRVTMTQLVELGPDARTLGRVMVSGSDSSFSTSTINVGENGDGELKLSDGARASATEGKVGVKLDTGLGTGLVTIEGTPLSSSEWHVTGDCEVGVGEPGTVKLLGTTLGPFSVGGATLAVDGTLTVNTMGQVLGNGTLTTSQRLVNGGLISPGLSPGVIVLNGDYEQTSAGILRVEAAGLNSGQFDIFTITGNATLGGALDVRFLNGYVPKTGDVLPFLHVEGAVNGDFAHVIFSNLSPGFNFKSEIVNGSYQITALNDGVPLPIKGRFRGLLQSNPPSNEGAGLFSIKVNARGGFSVRGVLGGTGFSFHGAFDERRTFTKTISRKDQPPLVIELEANTDTGELLVTGEISSGGISIPVSAELGTSFNRGNPAPQAGRYTMVMEPDANSTDSPQADGVGTVRVDTSGKLRFAGVLADGTPVSQGAVLSADGEWPLYLTLYKKKGSISGEIVFRDVPESDFDGSLAWSKPPRLRDEFYPDGFFTTLSATGSTYVAPGVGITALDFASGGNAMLSGGDLGAPFTKAVTLAPPAQFTVIDPGAELLSLSANSVTGTLGGKFKHPVSARVTPLRGVLFQKQNFGAGFFLGIGHAGSLEINPSP
jgi:T5SS/PEP-CTERM-associated repeat protein